MSFKAEFDQNIYEPWASEYVAYTPIYDSFYQLCNEGSWNNEDEKDFESAIRLEATKVSQFMNRKQREIETRINHSQRILSSSNPTTSLKQSTDDELTNILADINELNRYTRMNFKALEILIQEHDKLTHTNRHPLFVEICRTRPLDSQRFDHILTKVSSLIDICRGRQSQYLDNKSTQDKQLSPPTYARYWVHADHLTEVKAILLFNLPMFTDAPIIEEEFEQTDRSKSIVYFDNDSFTHYAARLQRDDGAEIINCHWNGNAAIADQVTFERRIYRKSATGGQIVSENMVINKTLAQKYISGEYTAEELKRHQNDIRRCYTTAKEIQVSILEHRLVPKLHVSFNRLLFKSPRDQHLSISLDSDVLFTKVKNGELFPPSIIESHDSHLFPHAILEIRAEHGGLPLWLSQLLQSRLVFEVPRFSSYLHGVAEFYSPQLALLPWWLSRLDVDIRTAAMNSMEYSGLSRSDSYRPLIDGHYRAGYLEAQLDRKDSYKNYLDKQRSVSSSNTICNPRHVINRVTSRSSADAKDTIMQVENASSSIYHTPLNSTTRLNAASSIKSEKSTKFIDYYNKKRNKKSEGYMLNNVNTINEDDALRHDAVIQMENEVRQKKKNKGKKFKPPVHTMEPKVFFANERTFIHWLQFSALIMTAALTLLNFGDRVSAISGGTFFGISMVLALYAFFRYRYRAYQINNRPHIRYDDLYGPIGLCCLLVGAMALNFVLRWKHPSSTDTYLGINNQTSTQTNQYP